MKGKWIPVQVLVRGKLVQKTIPTRTPSAIGSTSGTIAAGKSSTFTLVLDATGVQQLSVATPKKQVSGDEVAASVRGCSTIAKKVSIGCCLGPTRAGEPWSQASFRLGAGCLSGAIVTFPAGAIRL